MNPLPLIDGCLFIDNSTLEYLQTCPRSAEYFVLDNKVSADDKPALNFGGACHAVLEHRFKYFDAEMTNDQVAFCEGEMHQLVDKWFTAKPNPIDDHRQAGLLKQVATGYLTKYRTDEMDTITKPDGTKLVEVSFAVPLTTLMVAGIGTIKVIFCGRIDRVVSEGEHLWLVDTKTSSMMGQQIIKEQKMSLQWKGYCWAFWRTTGTMPYGMIIDGIRVRRPNTTERGKAQRPDVVPDDFQRFRLILEDHHINEWQQTVVSLIEEFLYHYKNQYYPMHTKWCVGKYGPCPYYEACELPPNNRAAMLTSGLFQENVWSPLNEIKQKQQTK